MMKSTISQRDWQTLSEYLDQELPTRQVDRLEDRLAKEPELKKALDELQRTRLLIRHQPKLRAPHNFTLTPAMVNRRVRSQTMSSSYPTVRFAMMMVIVLLVVVLAGDGWYSLSAYRTVSKSILYQPESAAEMAVQVEMIEPVVEQPVEEAGMAESSEAESAEAESPQVPGEAASSAMKVEPEATDAPSMKSMAEAPVEGTPIPDEGSEMLRSEAPSTLMPEDSSSETADQTERQADQAIGLEEKAFQPGDEVDSLESIVAEEDSSTVRTTDWFFSPMRILILAVEVTLAVLVVILGLLVYRMRTYR